jgi:peptide/nickel transport system permease protein
MKQAPWLAIFPGLAITLAIFGFNFIGDALRDAIDPRLRGR